MKEKLVVNSWLVNLCFRNVAKSMSGKFIGDSITQAVQYLKGGSSRVLRKEFPELEEFLLGSMP